MWEKYCDKKAVDSMSPGKKEMEGKREANRVLFGTVGVWPELLGFLLCSVDSWKTKM